jgi:hypothetical protein
LQREPINLPSSSAEKKDFVFKVNSVISAPAFKDMHHGGLAGATHIMGQSDLGMVGNLPLSSGTAQLLPHFDCLGDT